MFLIRLAFWMGLVVLVLPADEQQQAKLYGTAVTTVETVTTFCDRNASACTAGAEMWETFKRKAEFGAKLASELAKGRPGDDAALQPAAARGRPDPRANPAARGTLAPMDLAPAWRAPMQRTGY
jgi:hypothetical protein